MGTSAEKGEGLPQAPTEVPGGGAEDVTMRASGEGGETAQRQDAEVAPAPKEPEAAKETILQA